MSPLLSVCVCVCVHLLGAGGVKVCFTWMTCCSERSQDRQCCWNRSLELSLTSMDSRHSPSNLLKHQHTDDQVGS